MHWPRHRERLARVKATEWHAMNIGDYFGAAARVWLLKSHLENLYSRPHLDDFTILAA